MRGWLLVGQKCTSAIPAPSRLYTVTISSIPEGDSVSITAVLETIDLKLVLTGCPFSSFPSQSPASACSFLNAAAECEAAKSGAALNTAPAKNSAMARVLTDFSSDAWNSSKRPTCAVGRRTPGEESRQELRIP